MKTNKKIMSIVLALFMLFSMFAIAPSAAKPDSAIDLFVEADKPSYKQGDIVTFTIYYQADAAVTGNLMVSGGHAFAYNKAVFEHTNPTSDVPSANGWKIDPNIPNNGGYDESISTLLIDQDCTLNGWGIAPADAEAYNWDAQMLWQIGDEVADVADPAAPEVFDCTKKIAVASFEMKIKADAPDGDYVFGWNSQAYEDTNGIVNDRDGGVFGIESQYEGFTSNYGFNNCTIHVGDAAPAGPVLNRTKTQVKASSTGRFLLRTMNSISAADFTALNGDADVIKNIVSAGFVVTTDATWNADAAKAAIASGSTANYKVGKTNYFYKNPAGTYEFGCLLDAPLAQGTNFQYCAFIEYKDAQGATQYLFYKDGAVNLTFEQVDTALKTPMA